MESRNCYVFFDFTFNNVKAGRVVIELFKDVVPKTVENFRALCTGEKGIGNGKKPLHYKDTRIHKVIPQCMVQGGDIINGDGSSGESIYGYFFEDENFDIKHNEEGLLGMISNGPHKNSSQFYITTVPCYHLDDTNVVFGKVVKGLDIIKEMSEVPRSNHIPLEDIIISNCGELQPNEPWNINENDGTEDIYPPWPNDLNKSLDEVDEEEIRKVLNNINTSGNTYYKKDLFLDAERKYKKVLRYIDWYLSNKRNKRQNGVQDLKNKTLLNLSLARLKMNKYKEAVEHCNEVLKINPEYGKAYYRRAQVKLALKEYAEAIMDLKKVHKLHPDNKYVKNLFDIVKTKKQMYTIKERQFCFKAFSN